MDNYAPLTLIEFTVHLLLRLIASIEYMLILMQPVVG